MPLGKPQNEQYLSRLARGVCGCCSSHPADPGYTTCANCRNALRLRSQKAYAALRLRVLEKYGGKCVACNDTDPTVLTIDHVFDDGAEERRKLREKGGMQNMYVLLDAAERRDDLQILCANCQLRKRHYGRKIETWPLTSDETCAKIEAGKLEPRPAAGGTNRHRHPRYSYFFTRCFEQLPPSKLQLRKELAMADYSALLDRHFKVSNVAKPMTLTLREVKKEEVGQDKESLPVAYFNEDPRGLVLNASRYNTIGLANGSRDTDHWNGTVIEITVDPNVRFKGKVTGGLVVRVVTPAPKA